MRRQIIDDYWLQYLNDLFGIKLIFLRSELNVATFWICMDARFLVWVVFTNFLLIDATDRCKISSDLKPLFFAVSLYSLSFFANTPFKLKNLRDTSWSKNNIRRQSFQSFLVIYTALFISNGAWLVTKS